MAQLDKQLLHNAETLQEMGFGIKNCGVLELTWDSAAR